MITQSANRDLQSSLNRTKKTTENNSSYWKLLTIGILTSFSAIAFSYFFYQFISSSIGTSVWLPLFFLLLFAVLFLLQVLFVYNMKALYIFAILQAFLLWGIFLIETDLRTSLIGFGISAVFLIFAAYSGKRQMRDLISIRFMRISRSVMSKFMTGMAVFIAMAYMTIGISGSTSIVSRTIFSDLLSSSSGIITKFYPGVSMEDSLRNNIEIVVSQAAEKNTTIAALPEDQKALAVNVGVIEYEKRISEFVGVQVDSRQQLSETLYSLVSFKIDELIGAYGSKAYLIVILIIALVLRSFAPFIYWPLIGISFLIYQALLAFGFVSLMLENHSKEYIAM